MLYVETALYVVQYYTVFVLNCWQTNREVLMAPPTGHVLEHKRAEIPCSFLPESLTIAFQLCI